VLTFKNKFTAITLSLFKKYILKKVTTFF